MKNFDKLCDNDKFKIEAIFIQMISNLRWNDLTLKNIDRQIPVNNFKNDHFCNEKVFQEIANFLISNYNGNIEETINTARQYIIDNHLLNSEPIAYKPHKIGTVIIREFLQNFLLKEFRNLFTIPEDIEEFFAKDPSLFSKAEKNCMLKAFEKVIWVTWDETNSNLSPFSFSKNRDFEEICDVLGLFDLYFKKEFVKLLIIFEGIELNNLRKPTIADANLDNDLWRPTPENIREYGLTKARSNIVLSSGYTPNRPEAVIKSENLKLGFLSKKIDNYA